MADALVLDFQAYNLERMHPDVVKEQLLLRIEDFVRKGGFRPSDADINKWFWLLTWGDGTTDRRKTSRFGATIQQFIESMKVPGERPGQFDPFKLRPKQWLILQRIFLAWMRGMPWKAVILKTRRYGITTFFLLFALERVLRIWGWRGSTIAKGMGDGEVFASIFRQVLHQIPEWALPPEVKKTKREFVFRHDDFKESAFTVFTANQGGIGRGDRTNMLHPTEPPHYTSRAQDQYYGAQPSLGEFAGNLEPWESTAKGYDRMFHVQWESAHEIDDPEDEWKSDFERLFIACYEHPDFRRPFASDKAMEKFAASIGKEANFGGPLETFYFKNLLIPYQRENPWGEPRDEDSVVRRALEQLHHARLLQIDKCRNSLDLRKQEYPFTPEEAFVSTGSPFFNLDIIRAWLPMARTDRHSDSTEVGNFLERHDEVIWTPSHTGLWTMRRDREVGVAYNWGADTASGFRTLMGTGGDEADFPTCIMAEVLTAFSVCELRAHVRPRVHAREIGKAAFYYGKARGYAERSITGDMGSMLTTMTDMMIGGWMVSECLLPSTRMVWQDGGEVTEQLVGFVTKISTKFPICEALAAFLEDEVGAPIAELPRRCQISLATLREMQYFDRVQSEAGKVTKRVKLEATRGHDDMVMTMALMLQARRVLMTETDLMSYVAEHETEEEKMYREMVESDTTVVRGAG